MDSTENITKRIVAFRDARDWKQFHNPKGEPTIGEVNFAMQEARGEKFTKRS